MCNEGYMQYLVCVSVCLSFDISLPEWLFVPQTNSPIQRWVKVEYFKQFTFVAELEHFLLQYGYNRSAKVLLMENMHAYETGPHWAIFAHFQDHQSMGTT